MIPDHLQEGDQCQVQEIGTIAKTDIKTKEPTAEDTDQTQWIKKQMRRKITKDILEVRLLKV